MDQAVTTKSSSAPASEPRILTIRNRPVLLDSDLAAIYGVETKALNRAVKRNAERFPEEFVFILEPQEVASLRRQIGTLKTGRGQHRKYLPYVFSEHGALMASTVINSPRAVQMSVFVVRACVKMRETLAQNKELSAKLAELERTLTDRLDDHEQAIVHILGEIKKLMEPV